jgi:hypothetical protein
MYTQLKQLKFVLAVLAVLAFLPIQNLFAYGWTPSYQGGETYGDCDESPSGNHYEFRRFANPSGYAEYDPQDPNNGFYFTFESTASTDVYFFVKDESEYNNDKDEYADAGLGYTQYWNWDGPPGMAPGAYIELEQTSVGYDEGDRLSTWTGAYDPNEQADEYAEGEAYAWTETGICDYTKEDCMGIAVIAIAEDNDAYAEPYIDSEPDYHYFDPDDGGYEFTAEIRWYHTSSIDYEVPSGLGTFNASVCAVCGAYSYASLYNPEDNNAECWSQNEAYILSEAMCEVTF